MEEKDTSLWVELEELRGLQPYKTHESCFFEKVGWVAIETLVYSSCKTELKTAVYISSIENLGIIYTTFVSSLLLLPVYFMKGRITCSRLGINR